MRHAEEFEVLTQLEARRRAAGRGNVDALFEDAAQALGCSVATVYRKLRTAGLSPARKQRKDAGVGVLPLEELRLVSGVLHASATQRGQRLPVRDVLDMLFASGKLSARVHESTVSRQLFAHRMHPDQLALPPACVQVAAKHINHVWQIDSTTGIYYYMPGGRLRFMPEDEFYKNKSANLVKAASDLLTRYSCVDVASHTGKGRHFLGGETAENLLEFASWCMWQAGRNPMHGVPFMLVMDPGAANKGHLMANFCKNSGIRLEHHAPGAARVTGSVEKFHDLIGMHFERRLRFQDPAEVTLQRLDEWLDDWLVSFCSTRIHSRHGKTRFEAWMSIKPEQLRVPVSLETLREAAVAHPEKRRVDNDKTVSFKGRTYELTNVPGVVAGLKVTLQVNVFRSPSIDVEVIDADTGEVSWHVVAPVVVNELGYRESSPVWGEEIRTAANSVVDDNRNAALKAAYKTGDGLPTIKEAERARKAHAQAFKDVVDVFADVKATQVPAYLPRRSTPLALPERIVEARRLNSMEACERLKATLREAYTPQVYMHVAANFPDGVPEDQLQAIAALFTPAQPVVDNRPAAGGLRVVGGNS